MKFETNCPRCNYFLAVSYDNAPNQTYFENRNCQNDDCEISFHQLARIAENIDSDLEGAERYVTAGYTAFDIGKYTVEIESKDSKYVTNVFIKNAHTFYYDAVFSVNELVTLDFLNLEASEEKLKLMLVFS